MKKNLTLLAIIFLLVSCGTRVQQSQQIRLSFLDDFIISGDLKIKETRVGGLSGIEYHGGDYFLISDDPGNPRFYKASIDITGRSIDTISINDVVIIDNTSEFLKQRILDLESIRYDPSDNKLVVTSEGSVKNGRDPSIFQLTPQGKFITSFELPDYFNTDGKQKPRHNGLFEGLTKSQDGAGYWAGMELPLVKDGPKPKLFPTYSPVRITYFDKSTGKAKKQFAMDLAGISKIPWMYFAINGLTEIIEFGPERFLVLERAYSTGYGSGGNTVRLFEVDAKEASNTLNLQVLKKSNHTPASKKLVFDFRKIKKQLRKEIIDNIEGMCFGPDLPNGNKTLLLVSDNNFNSLLGKQITQIILMEVQFVNE